MIQSDSYLRKRMREVRGEANRVKALLGLRGERWPERHRVAAELRHLEETADELEAELDVVPLVQARAAAVG